MTRLLAAVCIVAMVVQVSLAADPAVSGNVVARFGEIAITQQQLEKPVVEGYGLNVLLNLVQLEAVKQAAKSAGVSVTREDVSAELEQTIEKMFKDSNAKLNDELAAAVEKGNTAKADAIRAQMKKDNAQAFEQFLTNQHIARPEFDIVIETNAYLRKIATPMLQGKITDDALKEAFAALYGETVQCRHIQCATLQDCQEAKRRLNAGEDFAKVAQELSINKRTGPLGGELPAFSRQMAGLPQNFRDAAFALREGEVSDIVQAENVFHLIKLEKRIPPKAIKFEDVKESVRQDLFGRALQATVTQLRQQIAGQAMAHLEIQDPVLKQQFEQRKQKRQDEIKDRDAIRQNLDIGRRPTTTPRQGLPDLGPALEPATEPAAAPTTAPEIAPTTAP